MNIPIYYVGGSKGGVGKSKMSFALIDYLFVREKKIMLIETDTSNPDVYKAHNDYSCDNLQCNVLNLDSSDGWLDLVNCAEDFPEHTIIINSAARSNTGIENYGATLRETLAGLNRNLITFWMINRQRDSVELLKTFLKAFPEAIINVCRNLYFGEPEKFEMYNDSQVKTLIEKEGNTFNFPMLSPRVADKLYSNRVPIWIACSEFRLSERYELFRWKNLCAKIFETALEENRDGNITNGTD